MSSNALTVLIRNTMFRSEILNWVNAMKVFRPFLIKTSSSAFEVSVQVFSHLLSPQRTSESPAAARALFSATQLHYNDERNPNGILRSISKHKTEKESSPTPLCLTTGGTESFITSLIRGLLLALTWLTSLSSTTL